MSEDAKKKWTIILATVLGVTAIVVGVLRAIGCEKSVEVADTIDTVIGEVLPDDTDEEVVEGDTEVVEEGATVEEVEEIEDPGDVLTMANEKCGEIAFSASLLPGDTGPQVKALQKWLRCSGEKITADGVYGKGTTEAVARHLPAD